MIQELASEKEWGELLEKSTEKLVLLFKHSTSCPVSAEAYQEFRSFVEKHTSDPYEYGLVKVIESRPVSNKIAEELDVKHQSPQLIVIKDNAVRWHDSHWRITEAKIAEVVS